MAKKQVVGSKPVAVAEVPVTERKRDDDYIPLSSITYSPGLDGGCDIGVWSLSATWGFEFET